MSALRILIGVLLAATPALADDRARVLLADADPELQRALVATLAPWRLEVVVDTRAPADATRAQALGDAQAARFVVWRERGDLVVYDRERREAQHRDAPDGPLDAASAAAAALTVKTLMRLPPPPPTDSTPAPHAPAPPTTPPAPPAARASTPPAPSARAQAPAAAQTVTPSRAAFAVAAPTTNVAAASPDAIDDDAAPAAHVVAPAAPPRDELRVQAGLAMRLARGDATALGARGQLVVFVRPTHHPLRLALAGEIGDATDVRHAGFRGRWRDWSIAALASWAIPRGRWEIEPYVGAGVLRSLLDGEEGMMERHERETLAMLRAGAFIRTHVGRFTVGGTAGFDAIAGTPTYTRAGNGSQFFAVPAFAVVLGVIASTDLTR